jgi:hypothetical protein
LHRFAYSVNVGMICVQNEKRKNKRKTGQITALKEKFYSDKNTVYLPRQVTKIALKTFENQGFFQNPT